MAKFLPIHIKDPKDRYSDQKVPKGRRLKDADIVSYVGNPYRRINLLSGDVMFINTVYEEARSLFNLNEIATAICGYNIYGPVLLTEKTEI